jgi:hypothetical protein
LRGEVATTNLRIMIQDPLGLAGKTVKITPDTFRDFKYEVKVDVNNLRPITKDEKKRRDKRLKALFKPFQEEKMRRKWDFKE